MTAAAFYCMSSDVYFLGVVAMVNSLRLVGHDELIYLLDCGLEPAQRELLEPQVTVVDPPRDAPPYSLKAVAPRAHPADVRVLIDADMIAVRSLHPLMEKVAGGGVLAFKDRVPRFVPEWGELLDIGPVEPQPHVSTGLVCIGGARGADLLELWDDRLLRIDYERSTWGRDDPGYALRYGDQDVLNAILASRFEAGELVALDDRLAPVPPFAGLRVADDRTLRCVYPDGTEPYVVHHFVAKPWLEPTHHGVYSQLLRRLLVGPGIAIRVPERMIPLRLRGGPLAWAERTRVNLGQRWRFHVREPLAARLGRSGGSE